MLKVYQGAPGITSDSANFPSSFSVCYDVREVASQTVNKVPLNGTLGKYADQTLSILQWFKKERKFRDINFWRDWKITKQDFRKIIVKIRPDTYLFIYVIINFRFDRFFVKSKTTIKSYQNYQYLTYVRTCTEDRYSHLQVLRKFCEVNNVFHLVG